MVDLKGTKERSHMHAMKVKPEGFQDKFISHCNILNAKIVIKSSGLEVIVHYYEKSK